MLDDDGTFLRPGVVVEGVAEVFGVVVVEGVVMKTDGYWHWHGVPLMLADRSWASRQLHK